MKKFEDLLNRDYKIVQGRRKFYTISLGIVGISLIFMLIWTMVFGSPFNMGMDFTGGYTLNVKLGTALTDTNYNDYRDKIVKVAEGLTSDTGENYKLKINSMQRQGSGADAAILVKYLGVASDIEMEQINTNLQEALREELFSDDKFLGNVSQGSLVSGSISGELLGNAFLAVGIAALFMLIYVAIRFRPISGLAAIVALLHDVVIMLCFMAVFRIEISSSFIAAIITIVGYSINNTLIIFDRVRENMKKPGLESLSTTEVANRSVRETLMRTINTTLTTLLTVGMVAIIGVPDIRIFALPIIIGLIAGTYSSVFVSPALWATWTERYSSYKKKKLNSKAQAKNAVKSTNA